MFCKLIGENTSLFISNSLSTFDGIIGLDLLKEVDAKIDLKNRELVLKSMKLMYLFS